MAYKTQIAAQQAASARANAQVAPGRRPEEAIGLRADNPRLPPRTWNEKAQRWESSSESDGWGELEFQNAAPDAGREWTDGDHRERRRLKHRADGVNRTFQYTPNWSRCSASTWKVRATADGHQFAGIRSTELPTITYRRAWIAARKAALTPEEQKSPLARRPYDLGHACLSTWLNGEVPATQAAEWAGHGVDVLLRIYAKRIVGQHEVAKRRIARGAARD